MVKGSIMGKMVTYGLGGYDPSKPNNNIVSIEEIPDLIEETNEEQN